MKCVARVIANTCNPLYNDNINGQPFYLAHDLRITHICIYAVDHKHCNDVYEVLGNVTTDICDEKLRDERISPMDDRSFRPTDSIITDAMKNMPPNFDETYDKVR